LQQSFQGPLFQTSLSIHSYHLRQHSMYFHTLKTKGKR
jgi:hypothetical protein